MKNNKSRFTPEEEARIQAAVNAELARDREFEIQAEIQNRTSDARRSKPGYQY